jgi:hypothetical protein
MIGSAARLFALLPESAKGTIDCYCRPRLAAGFGPLNGQRLRQQMIVNLLKVADVACIVETGTYRGTSTVFFSEFRLPVFTVESNARYYTYSRIRLRKIPHVTVVHQDSVYFLRDQLPQKRLADETILFYLDAHWYARLPTRNELEAILTHFNSNIIIIYDFEVPDDPGYGFDDYGIDKRLNLDYLKTVASDVAMMIFFPAAHSSEETGARRGSCIITSNPALGERLRAIRDLRFFGMIGGACPWRR